MVFADRRQDLTPLAFDDILLRCERHRVDPGFVDLCTGTSRFQAARFLDLALAAPGLAEVFGYGEFAGRLALRQRLAAIQREEWGVEIDPERILVTDGASGALHVAFLLLLGPGDQVLLPRVCYPPYQLLAELVGATPVFVALDEDFGYDQRALERAVTPRTRAIVVNSPANPLMSELSRSRLEGIVSIGVPVISDEVYALLGHERVPISMLQISQDQFVVNSLSKSHGAAGFRVGHLIVPEPLIAAARAVKATINVSTSLPSQILAHALLSSHRPMLAAHRAFLRERFACFQTLCRRHGVKILGAPSAGFFCAVDASGAGLRSDELAVRLLEEEGIAICPGIDFGQPDFSFVRLNYSLPSADLERAIPVIASRLGAARRHA